MCADAAAAVVADTRTGDGDKKSDPKGSSKSCEEVEVKCCVPVLGPGPVAAATRLPTPLCTGGGTGGLVGANAELELKLELEGNNTLEPKMSVVLVTTGGACAVADAAVDGGVIAAA